MAFVTPSPGRSKKRLLNAVACLPSLDRAMIHILTQIVKHFLMETLRVLENDLREHDKRLPDQPLFYFKLVSVGMNTLKANDHQPVAVCDLVSQQPGNFLFTGSTNELRAALHDLVDTFVDKFEETTK